MRDYKRLFRFEAWAKALLIAAIGLFLGLAGQVDTLGVCVICTIALAYFAAGIYDFKTTNNTDEAAADHEFGFAQSVVIGCIVVAAVSGFLWLALTR